MGCLATATRSGRADRGGAGYSVNEAGLYDYIICNEDLAQAGQELQAVALRALQGLVGRPADQPPAAPPAQPAPQVR